MQIIDGKCSITGCIFAVAEQVFAQLQRPVKLPPRWWRFLSEEGGFASLLGLSLAQDPQVSLDLRTEVPEGGPCRAIPLSLG